MRTTFPLSLLAGAALLGLSACSSVGVDSGRIGKKAAEYRRSGVARDMVEAQRMAEEHYWPESARIKEDTARNDRAAALSKR